MFGRRRFQSNAGVRKRHKAGEMNGLESRYAAELDLRVRSGEIVKWRFERHTLVLANGCRYTPDFEVLMPDGTKEFHEVKGHCEDDALVKIKMAAELFDEYRFFMFTRRARKDGGGWNVREF